jgi:hypothetical protein
MISEGFREAGQGLPFTVYGSPFTLSLMPTHTHYLWFETKRDEKTDTAVRLEELLR